MSEKITPELKAAIDKAMIHIKALDRCEHDFAGWREFDDGLGGEQVCTKCGWGAMAYTLSLDDLP